MTFGLSQTPKEVVAAWKKGEVRMHSDVVEIDGVKYEKITVDPNNVIFKPIPEEQIVTTRKKKREPDASAEREPGSS
jgi:hypothetical protein